MRLEAWERRSVSSHKPQASSLKPRYILSMPVDPALLAILVCPHCKTPVHPVKDGAGLKCETCRRVYPVKDDIPVMLIDEATIEN